MTSTSPRVRVAARTAKQPAGVAVSKTGRMFINFPRWVDEPTPSVAEVAADGSLIPYPNAEINNWDKKPGKSAADRFVCVQSIFVDDKDCLWILDPASPIFAGVIPGGPKLLKVNLATNQIERTYHFDDQTASEKSYLNDVRIAHGYAFISDSGLGAIVTVDLSTGKIRRLLEDHPSTKAEPGVELIFSGRSLRFANGTTPQVHSDGIAIDPKQKYVFYKALTGRNLYRVPIKSLIEASSSLGACVEQVAVLQPTDGLEFDARGNLYLTAIEENAIKVLRPNGKSETMVIAPNFLWPDTIAIAFDSVMFFTTSQFQHMPFLNGDVDRRTPPYEVFCLNLNGT